MRIAVVGSSHETNTFSPNQATVEAFRDLGCYRGRRMLDLFGDATHMISGFVDAAREEKFELVPLVFYDRPPSGLITRAAGEMIGDEIVAALKAEGPFDAVLMPLHGAAVSALDRDFDGHLVRRVRATVGTTPIAACFDLHANVTPSVPATSDIAVYYRTNPHVDARQRGLECGRAAAGLARGTFRAAKSFIPLPMAIVISHQDSSEEPLRSIYAEMEEACRDRQVLTIGLAQGYQYADVPQMGTSVYCATRGNQALADDLATRFARRVWGERKALNTMPRSPEGVFAEHRAEGGLPLGILDIGDNIGGGATGDSTVLLHLARKEKADGVVTIVIDPPAVKDCIAAGPGGRVAVAIGGKLPGTPAEPFPIEGTVTLISDGRYEDLGPVHGGYRHFDGGPTAVVETDDGITLVLTTNIGYNSSKAQLYALGIRPETKRFLLLRGVNSPRASYRPVCRAFLPVDTPGLTMADYRRFRYEHRRRPMYPFEADAAWPGATVPVEA